MNDESTDHAGRDVVDDALKESHVFELLMSAVDERVGTRVQERWEHSRAWILGTLAVIIAAVTVVGGILVNHRVDKIVNESVARVVAEEYGAALFDNRVASLNAQALRLDLSDSFNRAEAYEIIATIGELYTDAKDEVQRYKLEFAFKAACDSFVSAAQPDMLLQLERAAPLVAESDAYYVVWIVSTLGDTLLADAAAPSSWTDTSGAMRDTYDTYHRYVDMIAEFGFPEHFLVYEMLLRYVEGKPDAEIKNLIDDADGLDDIDGDGFVALMEAQATGELILDSDTASERAVRRVAAFLCKFGGQGIRMSSVVNKVQPDCG